MIYKFNPHDIEALKVRAIENARREKDIGATSIDELRAEIGREEWPGGAGNVILQNASEVPLGESPLMDLQLLSNQERADFIRILSATKNKTGQRKYSDEEIMRIVENNGMALVVNDD